MPRTIRIASCSIMPAKWDKAANAEKMLAFMERAMEGSPDLIVTPEGCLEGYVVNEAIREGRGAEMLEVAEPADGELIGRFRQFCRSHRVHALVCFAERMEDEAYNTALWIGRDGQTVGFYRKTHLNEGYDPDWYFDRPGDQIRAFDTEFGRVGVMICFDRRVPEVARCLMLDGAQVLLVPSYGVYSGWNDAILVARAHENGLPVVFTHPNKTLVVDAGGNIRLLREETDAISHVTVELAEPETNLMRKLRRPELYGRLLER